MLRGPQYQFVRFLASRCARQVDCGLASRGAAGSVRACCARPSIMRTGYIRVIRRVDSKFQMAPYS